MKVFSVSFLLLPSLLPMKNWFQESVLPFSFTLCHELQTVVSINLLSHFLHIIFSLS